MTEYEPVLHDVEGTYPAEKYRLIKGLYNKHKKSFWTDDMMNFHEDLNDWDHKLAEQERFFLKHILAFFANADKMVADNLIENFTREIVIRESKEFYAFQTMMENIHNETYTKMLKTYIRNNSEMETLLRAHEQMPCIKAKMQWANKWMNQSRSIGERLVAFICIEGIHFSSSFAGIYWIKEKGLMKWLCTSNEYIARDEGLHVMHGIALFNALQAHRPSKETIHQIFREAVELECNFCNDAIPCSFIGLSPELMARYIKYIADWYLGMMNVELLYNIVESPLEFMKKITGKIEFNFFEVDNVNYRVSSSTPDDGDYRPFDDEDEG